MDFYSVAALSAATVKSTSSAYLERRAAITRPLDAAQRFLVR
jgi:hypothetical protein